MRVWEGTTHFLRWVRAFGDGERVEGMKGKGREGKGKMEGERIFAAVWVSLSVSWVGVDGYKRDGVEKG